MPRAALAPIALVLAACQSTCAARALPASAGVVAGRPYRVDLPPGYDPARPAPLLLVLHPYMPNGPSFTDSLGLRPLAARRGVIVVTPTGRVDRDGRSFWSATDGCCDFYGAGDDDVAYLEGVLADVRRRLAVDPRRIYALGYSNGAFMAHRLACEGAGVTAIVAMVGVGFLDPARCRAPAPVAVLQVSADGDRTVPYEGGRLPPEFPAAGPLPSARASTEAWARRDGCGGPEPAPPVDLDGRLAGAETTVTRWPGCAAGAVELWTVRGGTHFLALTPAGLGAMLDFLLAR